MSKSNMLIARESLAAIIRYFREDVMEVSRDYVSMQTGVSRKALNRLEHASPRQKRWEIEPVIKFFRLPRHKKMLEFTFEERRMLALDLLDVCFPDETILTSEERKEIPVHLLAVFKKKNRRRTRRFRQWPHKIRSYRVSFAAR